MTKKKVASHKSVTSPFEVSFAIAFLKDIHANYNNLYLLLAVIAWMRGNNLSGKYAAGYNPFHLTLRGGKLAKYSSIAAGAKAFATYLTKAGFTDILTAPHTLYAKDTADQQKQAMDFLEAVALSTWDSKHYGVPTTTHLGPDGIPITSSSYDASQNSLIAIWSKLLGHDVILPSAQPPKQPQAGVPLPPSVRNNLAHWQYPDYLQPYAAEHFLEARDKPVAPLSVGVRGTL